MARRMCLPSSLAFLSLPVVDAILADPKIAEVGMVEKENKRVMGRRKNCRNTVSSPYLFI